MKLHLFTKLTNLWWQLVVTTCGDWMAGNLHDCITPNGQTQTLLTNATLLNGRLINLVTIQLIPWKPPLHESCPISILTMLSIHINDSGHSLKTIWLKAVTSILILIQPLLPLVIIYFINKFNSPMIRSVLLLGLLNRSKGFIPYFFFRIWFTSTSFHGINDSIT